MPPIYMRVSSKTLINCILEKIEKKKQKTSFKRNHARAFGINDHSFHASIPFIKKKVEKKINVSFSHPRPPRAFDFPFSRALFIRIILCI